MLRKLPWNMASPLLRALLNHSLANVVAFSCNVSSETVPCKAPIRSCIEPFCKLCCMRLVQLRRGGVIISLARLM